MEALWTILLDYTKTHLATEHNIGMILATWMLIWAMERPIRKFVEGLPKHKQTVWWSLQRNGKQIAGVVWCEIFVWIPTVQPPLCETPDALNCQTIMGRVLLGIILGGALSLLHKYVLARLKRVFGMGTKEPDEVSKSRYK